MYSTKSEPTIKKDGKIKTFIEIKGGVLLINDKYKFEDGKWYFYGEDQKWYFLGVGANPNIIVDSEDVVDMQLFEDIFEKIPSEQQIIE